MEIETTRNLLYKACWLRDQQRPFRKEAAMAKLWASEVMRRVTHAAVQIFGGYGLMEEYPVGNRQSDGECITDEVNVMPANGKLLPELCCDHAAASVRWITRNTDLHRFTT